MTSEDVTAVEFHHAVRSVTCACPVTVNRSIRPVIVRAAGHRRGGGDEPGARRCGRALPRAPPPAPVRPSCRVRMPDRSITRFRRSALELVAVQGPGVVRRRGETVHLPGGCHRHRSVLTRSRRHGQQVAGVRRPSRRGGQVSRGVADFALGRFLPRGREPSGSSPLHRPSVDARDRDADVERPIRAGPGADGDRPTRTAAAGSRGAVHPRRRVSRSGPSGGGCCAGPRPASAPAAAA